MNPHVNGPNDIVRAAAAAAGWTLGDLNSHVADWVAALRSGDYRQAHGAMRIGDGPTASYCCLGVAACLAGIEFVHWVDQSGATKLPRLYGVSVEDHDTPQSGYLPHWLNDLLGIYAHDNEDLTSINDAERSRYDFAHIANVVELAARARLADRHSDPMLRAHEALLGLGGIGEVRS